MEKYLSPTKAIDSDNDSIIEKAFRLTSHCGSDPEKAAKLFYFVRDSIHYNVYMISTFFEDFIASTVLSNGKGYCVQKAVLLTALARAAGIPSRLIFAKIRNHRMPKELIEQTGIQFFPSHGYTQLYVNDRWINATPAFDRELCEKGGVPAVEFDGVHDASLAAEDLSGKPYIEYIEKYEPQADFPFEWLHGRVSPIWGEKHSWLKNEDSRGHRMPSGYLFE
jgi:transglutaminase-like putative cysteine protease